jgi:flagellar hook-associated protein 3 FlgL
MRITNNIISQSVLANIQRNTRSLANLQEVLSTGRKFHFPEQNPIAYVESLNLRQEISENRRYQRNLTLGDTGLNLTESVLSTINDRLQRARQLALQGSSGGIPPESREAVASEIEQILTAIIEQANSNFEGKYIFSGDQTLTMPFERYISADGVEGVIYRGDFGDRMVEINQGELLPVKLTGPGAFFSSLNEIRSSLSLVSNLPLAPQLATVAPPLTGVAGTFTIDGVTVTFDPATDTLETLRDAINRTVDTADARIDSNGKLVIRSLTSNDVQLANGTSNVLEVLGMYHRIEGNTLGVGITGATTLVALGITGDALQITVGEDEYKVDLAGATTVANVISAINSSGAPVEAYINSAGTGLTISTTQSVDSLQISSLRRIFAVSALGPGTVTQDTTLASLGIATPGTLNITNDGDTTAVDLSGATTIADVIHAINTQVNGVTASINADGSGIDLESAFFSTSLSAADVGTSTIATVLGFAQTRAGDSSEDLGINSQAQVDEAVGQNIFRSLAELAANLRSPDATADDFGQVLTKFDTDLDTILSNRSIVGARINRVQSAEDRLQAFEAFLTQLLSDNEDADLAETITDLSTQANVLNASLAAGARLLQNSLIDFLR